VLIARPRAGSLVTAHDSGSAPHKSYLTPRETRVFFRQIRLTRHNREFRVFKFRSIKHGLQTAPQRKVFARMGRPDLLKTIPRKTATTCRNDPSLYSHRPIYPCHEHRRATAAVLMSCSATSAWFGPTHPSFPQELNSYERKTFHPQRQGWHHRPGAGIWDARTSPSKSVVPWISTMCRTGVFWLDISILIRTLRGCVSPDLGDKIMATPRVAIVL
jgi:hypothetical protein